MEEIYWTRCSCGHIAQEHTIEGKCEAHGDPCRLCNRDQMLCPCKKYDGVQHTYARVK